jgi:hypothetical protein
MMMVHVETHGAWALRIAFSADWQGPDEKIGGCQQRNLAHWGISPLARHRGQRGGGSDVSNGELGNMRRQAVHFLGW